MIHPHLTQYLSRSDLMGLLEVSYASFQCHEKEHLSSIIQRLNALISFENITLWYGKASKPFQYQLIDCINFGSLALFLDKYLSQDCYPMDPVTKEALSTLNFVDIPMLFKKKPATKNHPIYTIGLEVGLSEKISFVYPMITRDGLNHFVATFLDVHSKMDQRIKEIIGYCMPFLSLMYEQIVMGSQFPSPSFQLTQREIEILKWLKEGKTSWEISVILNISERTANFHIANLMRKLNATKRTQAVAIALKAGVIDF